ncbi:SET domain-containing protein-lysine N-methyltransferase [Mucilaginibacter sp. UYCu711]|uniref:SET domain-containing protein-lysine N-methyltransferase n=1 Tax=Mucilaginibacter sp. UYCu711 TaxID=3156339 RepID=UPI003D213A73
MDESLKNDLAKLLEAHPELKNRQLVFSADDVVFGKDAEQLLNKKDDATLCRPQPQLPDVIKGHSPKIEVRRSPVHGYGVFAKEVIDEGEFIEECKLLKMGWRGLYPSDPTIKDYAWGNRGCTCIECRRHGVFQYLALGLGSIYNHADAPNTKQNLNFKTEVFTIKARRRIEKDEEIFVTYGDKYFLVRDFWKNIQKTNELEKVAKAKKNAAQTGEI